MLYCGEDSLFSYAMRKAGLKFKLASDAIVYWRPRSNLWQVFRQYFLYGVGNGRNGVYTPFLSRQAIKNFAGFFLFIFLVMGRHFFLLIFFAIIALLLFYFRYELQKGELKKVFLGIVVVRVRNMAESLGFVWGTFQRKFVPRYRTSLSQYLGKAMEENQNSDDKWS